MKIVRKPVGINCAKCCKVARRPPGVMVRINLSRLEEGLGHEGFQCGKCGERVKYVPAVAS